MKEESENEHSCRVSEMCQFLPLNAVYRGGVMEVWAEVCGCVLEKKGGNGIDWADDE